MSKFNKIAVKNESTVLNRAGGQAFELFNEEKLVTHLLTSFVQDSFYRTESESVNELKDLLKRIQNKKFAAKAAIFTRNEFGMRSVSHIVASELASQISGASWGKDFYDKIVSRPDDMCEILSYYINNNTDKNNPKFPASMKRGFAKAFDKFDDYQVAKYKNSKKEVKLLDVVNLVHPTPTTKNKESLKSLIGGKLKNTHTWESMLSKAGQEASDETELKNLKSQAWSDLINSNRLGYMAALRNINNILEQAPELCDKLCDILTNEKMIKNSKILPFRFTTAMTAIQHCEVNLSLVRKVMVAIDKALEISMTNVPKFDGETLVVIDTSGSMSGKPSEIASLFGAMIVKVNSCDVMTFDNYARYQNYNPNDSVTTIQKCFEFSGGGTNFQDIFIKANKSYDRIIILSDMQGWIGHTTPLAEFNSYKSKFGCDPFIYSWDLQGLSTTQLPQDKIFLLAGFSDKVFDIMKFLETDQKTLMDRIDSIVV